MARNQYKVIVFDLGNVLIPFDHGRWVENLNKIKSGLGSKMFEKFRDNHDIQMEYEGGKISDDEFIDICLKWLDYKITPQQFRDIFSDIFSLNQNVIDLLPSLKSKYKLVLLSNTSNIHREYAWGKLEFINHFDKLILSHEIGAVKPENRIYKAVEEFTEEEPGSHIFIDDILEYVEKAKSLGWDGIHFTGYADLMKEFNSRSIL
jgi:putative hydrolase of the HAD superfamily